jgi:putative flippase GtrA
MALKFIKAQASSLAATIIDHGTAIFLKEVIGVWFVTANIVGNIAGGVTNFLINRQWVFEKENRSINLQAIKYILVWTGNMILNLIGVWLLVNYKILPYVWAKITVAIVIGATYNYMIQKRFVFK